MPYMSDTYPTPEETQLRNIERFDRILSIIIELNAVAEELRRGMAALAEVMVTRADLDDAKLELRDVIAEATATPFDPPPTQEGQQ